MRIHVALPMALISAIFYLQTYVGKFPRSENSPQQKFHSVRILCSEIFTQLNIRRGNIFGGEKYPPVTFCSLYVRLYLVYQYLSKFPNCMWYKHVSIVQMPDAYSQFQTIRYCSHFFNIQSLSWLLAIYSTNYNIVFLNSVLRCLR